MKRQAGFAFAAVLGGTQALFVALYIGHERTIYFWDHAMYFNMARQLFFLCGQNPAGAWSYFQNALAGNYNLVFALPSLASFWLFGATRLVFILTNFFVFFLAFEGALAFLLRRALDIGWDAALALSLIGAALVPPLWLPSLEGYPDIGAAACITLAAAFMLNGPGTHRLILRGLGAGIVLGLGVLLRRHFIYAVVALLIAGGCCALWDITRAPGKERRFLIMRAALYFAACGFGCVGLLALIAPDFLRTALTTDYRGLYLSYQRPALVFLYFVLGGFGYGLLLIAASGLFALARTGAAGRRLALFTALYVLLWLVIWCGGPDQMGHHYILQALPLGVIVGLAGWAFFLAGKPQRIKYALGGAAFLFLAANSAWALWFSPTGVWPNDNGKPGLFSAPRPPVVRSDYDEWLRVARYLQDTTGPDDRVMLVGSSFVLNLDLLRSIYVDILGAPAMTARFPKPPEIDHEEPAPLNIFATADVYVVPTPPQYHLDPAGQRVVTAAANRFPPPPALAPLFHADDALFHLADGTTVKIWRRAAWPPGLLYEALAAIRSDGPQDRAFAQDWVTMAMPLMAQIHTDNSNRSWVGGFFDTGHRDMKLFFDYPLAPGTYNLRFSVAGDCGEPRLRLQVASAGGKTESAKDFAPAPDGEVFQSFAVPAKPDKGHFLMLDVGFAPASLCRAELHGLFVEQAP